MIAIDEHKQLLKELGLGDYEADALVCLLSQGMCTAEEISKFARIPLPRVYDTMRSLGKTGAVISTKTRPKQYRILDPDHSLAQLVSWRKEQMQQELEKLQAVFKKLKEKMSVPQKGVKPTKDHWGIWTIEGRYGLKSLRQTYLRKAEEEVLLFSGDASFIIDDATLIKRLTDKGITVRMLVGPSERTREVESNIETARASGIEVKENYTGHLKGTVIDHTVALVALKHGLTTRGRPGDDTTSLYEMVLIDNPYFLKFFVDYFSVYWERA